ncbi:hypothetical protein ZWY2020_030808 [Hordeum vulgare]|nr:hypothetical protein ZWY2020_030808 [Hordeum vulgare]
MRSVATLLQLVCLLLSLHRSSCSGVAATARDFSSCLVSNGVSSFSLPTSPSYAGLLNSSIFNLRFTLPNVARPAAVVLPESRDELRRAILCARASSLAIRVRSGGHSYEGLSYTTENHVPFVVIDIANLNRVRVVPGSAMAWAESGATVGELYYVVGRSNRSLAFPAGSGSTTGLGGHVSGGGFGLVLKFGLAADNVLDAALITSDGRIHDRSSMGDDVVWAIRGGGGGSWGVVYAWKLRLVPVPRNVTVFTVDRTGPVELIAGLVHRWQYVGPNLPDEYYLSVYAPTGSTEGNVSISFTGQDPRAAYVNYLDLDLGLNNWTRAAGGSSAQAVARARSSWGHAYFGENFDRLVRAKMVVDPSNVFNNAQSIPPLNSRAEE